MILKKDDIIKNLRRMGNNMNNKEIYDDIFYTLFDVKKGELKDNFTFNDVEVWDSIAHLSLITMLEDAFDIMFETEDILSFGSYENGKTILRKYGITIND